jgi:hypothetical protein
MAVKVALGGFERQFPPIFTLWRARWSKWFALIGQSLYSMNTWHRNLFWQSYLPKPYLIPIPHLVSLSRWVATAFHRLIALRCHTPIFIATRPAQMGVIPQGRLPGRQRPPSGHEPPPFHRHRRQLTRRRSHRSPRATAHCRRSLHRRRHDRPCHLCGRLRNLRSQVAWERPKAFAGVASYRASRHRPPSRQVDRTILARRGQLIRVSRTELRGRSRRGWSAW